MRICFIPNDFDGSGYYRCIFPSRELNKRGHESGLPPHTVEENEESYLVDWTNPEYIWPEVNADVYVLQTRHEAGMDRLVRKLQEQGAVVVFEIDDWVLGVPAYNPAFLRAHPKLRPNVNRQHMHRTLAACDHVTATTPFLSDEYARLNPRITVIPNYLDWEMWEDVPLQYEQERERLRIGYMGISSFHSADIGVLRGILGPFLRRHPEVDFVAAGDAGVHDMLDVPEGQRITHEFTPFRHMKLPEITATFDIGLVPLEMNNFNEAKSHLKGMEYAACGIPCIATPTESYRNWVDVGETGLLAKRGKDWLRSLELLVGDSQLRRSMGAAARSKAQRNTIQEHVDQYENVYLGLTESKELIAA